MIESTTKPHLFKRFIAGFIDYFLVFGFFIIFVYSFGKPNDDGGYSITGILGFIPILFWFVIIVLVEVFCGATFGNYLMKLKPKSLINNIEKVSFNQSLKRHLLDLIDMFPFGLIAIITIKNTDKNQRLGDIWAKTIIVNIEDDK